MLHVQPKLNNYAKPFNIMRSMQIEITKKYYKIAKRLLIVQK